MSVHEFSVSITVIIIMLVIVSQEDFIWMSYSVAVGSCPQAFMCQSSIGKASFSPARSSSAATFHCMWRFWRDGIEFVFHLSFFCPTRFDWEQALLLPPVRGMPLPKKRVCSLLPHALECQLFPIFFTCRALGQTYRGLLQPRWEENKTSGLGCSWLSKHQDYV